MPSASACSSSSSSSSSPSCSSSAPLRINPCPPNHRVTQFTTASSSSSASSSTGAIKKNSTKHHISEEDEVVDSDDPDDDDEEEDEWQPSLKQKQTQKKSINNKKSKKRKQNEKNQKKSTTSAANSSSSTGSSDATASTHTPVFISPAPCVPHSLVPLIRLYRPMFLELFHSPVRSRPSGVRVRGRPLPLLIHNYNYFSDENGENSNSYSDGEIPEGKEESQEIESVLSFCVHDHVIAPVANPQLTEFTLYRCSIVSLQPPNVYRVHFLGWSSSYDVEMEAQYVYPIHSRQQLEYNQEIKKNTMNCNNIYRTRFNNTSN